MEDLLKVAAGRVDVEGLKTRLMAALEKQKAITLGKASYELRALEETKGLEDPTVRRKVLEFLSDADVNAMEVCEISVAICACMMAEGKMSVEAMVSPDFMEVFSEFHPPAAQFLSDLIMDDEEHIKWLNKVSSNIHLIEEFPKLERYENGLDFIDYNPNASNPLDRFWIGGQG